MSFQTTCPDCTINVHSGVVSKDALRDATMRFVELDGVQSGQWAACSAQPQWLISQGFPATLVEPLVGNHDGIKGVSILSLLWKLVDIFDADASDAQQWTFARKRCGRQLAASLKDAILSLSSTEKPAEVRP